MELGFAVVATSATLLGAGGGSSLSSDIILLVLRGSRGRAGVGVCGGGAAAVEIAITPYGSCMDTGGGRCKVDIDRSFADMIGVVPWGTESLKILRTGWG